MPFILADEDGRELKPRKSGNDLAGLIEATTNRRQQNWQQFVVASMIRPLLDGHLMWHRIGLQGNRPGEVMIRPVRKPEVRQDEFGDDFAARWLIQATGEALIPNDELFEWKLDNPYDDVYGLAPLSPAALPSTATWRIS